MFTISYFNPLRKKRCERWQLPLKSKIQNIYNLLKNGIRYEEFTNKISPAFRDSEAHEETIYKIMTVYNTYRSVMPQLFPGLCLVLAINITYEAALQKRTKGQMDDTQERIG